MRLRPPEMADRHWIKEAYEDWPESRRGPVTEQKAVDWIRRWTYRTDEECRVLEDIEPLGLITFRRKFLVCYVDNIVVRPKWRGHGVSTKLIRLLRHELVREGIMVAEFETLPGVIRDQLGKRYQDLGNGRGRLTWDMPI